MHDSQLDPVIKARFTALKGGREFAFTRLDPARTAHLVVDMQNGFVEAGALLEVPQARNVVGNINAVSQALRARGGVNLFLRFSTRTTGDWSVYFEQFMDPASGRAEVADFLPGTHGHALYPQLDVQPGDLVVDKYRFSAFTPGSSNTLEVLQARGIDTVVISGTLTDCCCEATARDAQQLGFRVVFLSDANAALTDAEHNAALNALAAWYADIRTAAQAVELVRAGMPAPVPA
ncbi:MAG: isochorismatase family cysteine hydrolase [Comamonas sp.]